MNVLALSPLQSAATGARSCPGGSAKAKPRQEQLSCQHEPRDQNTNQCYARHERNDCKGKHLQNITQYSSDISRAGKTLLLIINNILDMSKIESGKLSITKEEYKTSSLITELSMIGAERAGRYGLSIKTEVDETLPSTLIGDMVHITQIVANFYPMPQSIPSRAA